MPVGIQRDEIPVPLGAWTLREYTIVGTVAHAMAADLPRAVELLAARADWSDLASEVLPLDELAEGALVPLTNGGARQIKTVIDPAASGRRPARHGSAR
ncbi:threonine dehydrogenase-like Zn-dependent dehydrogenase [Microbacterium testaceum]|uniref:hypothetical protein n=1 Tax=Microbacterium testaceum TaxID=2033 RepID=UPI00277ED709|nr:hypothetical protein [Microbacterium testaceum]MDQ1174653.1 threonine dehydrogenase-like Zn-dependent dehydrogenase [Microbacterium testaceum]